MQTNTLRSVGAVLAGFVLIGLLGFVTDSALQAAGVLPVTGTVKFEPKHALLALSYHLVSGVIGGYVTARLAPSRPVAHAVALGVAGIVFSGLGLIAIVTGDLAPAWYGWALVLLSVPITWLGGRPFVRGISEPA
jgi:hypothetical protein